MMNKSTRLYVLIACCVVSSLIFVLTPSTTRSRSVRNGSFDEKPLQHNIQQPAVIIPKADIAAHLNNKYEVDRLVHQESDAMASRTLDLKPTEKIEIDLPNHEVTQPMAVVDNEPPSETIVDDMNTVEEDLFNTNEVVNGTEVENQNEAVDDSAPSEGIGLDKEYPQYPKELTTQAKVIPNDPEQVDMVNPIPSDDLVDVATEDDDGNIVLPDEIFEDAKEFEEAPTITVKPESKYVKYRLIVLQHERYYRKNAMKLYCPRLKKTAKLSKEEFYRRFVFTAQPVIIPFEATRHLNFTMKSYSLDELLELYPNHKPKIYKYGAIQDKEELDLGPAVYALKSDQQLKKNMVGRNFPRNTKIHLETLSKINLQQPPYVLPETSLMPPSLWFATESDATKFHSDCCDNFAFMISGTKRWVLSPPSEARIFKPNCTGGLCWVQALHHPDEHAKTRTAIRTRDQAQLLTVDLNPGEMLYLPAGWFHHVENIGPTIMVNYWTHGGPGFLRRLDGEFNDIANED